SAYAITVTIADAYGRTATATSTANVAQMPLLVGAAPVVAAEGMPVPAGTTVATFTDTGGAEAAGDDAASRRRGGGAPPTPAPGPAGPRSWPAAAISRWYPTRPIPTRKRAPTATS